MAHIDRQDTYQKVASVIAKQLSIDATSIKGSDTLQDLGADSIALVEIIMKLEELFSIEINDEKAEHLKNVDDVVNYVHSLRAE